MQCHEVDYQIIGHDLQMVEVTLDPGETIIAEAGTMTYMEQDIAFETRMGDGSDRIIDQAYAAGRILPGEQG